LAEALQSIAPLGCAEPWDNVGWLVGRRGDAARRVMTCLTISPTVVREAIEGRADVIVTHHPLPFHPLRRIVRSDLTGRMLLDLIGHDIGIYSPHTAFDSAADGINALLARQFDLQQIRPIVPGDRPVERDCPAPGSGRCGRLASPMTLAELAARVRSFTDVEYLTFAGSPQLIVRTLGIACGAGHSFWSAARAAGCDALLTGEARFHDAIAAEGEGHGLIAIGHYASERFAVQHLAEQLQSALPELHVWASQMESDPWRSVGAS
jgi:dinuclear metal center YbgI/SA1388 family protein